NDLVTNESVAMSALVGMEWHKLIRRRASWLLMAIIAVISAVVPPLIYFSLKYAESDATDAKSKAALALVRDQMVFPNALAHAVVNALAFGIPLMIVLTAMHFGNEYAWGTIRLLLSRGEGRGAFVLSKVLALTFWWGATLILAISLSWISSTVIGVIDDRPMLFDASGSDWSLFVGRFAAAWLGGLVYAALTLAVTVRLRSTAFGVAMGLGAFFGERISGAGLALIDLLPIQILMRAGPSYNVRSLIDGLDGQENPLAIAMVAVAFYTLAFTWGTIRFLRRNDVLTGGAS
ncbi:MAG: ABC transporter permease, partial [Chloroflexota bacterium]|nr:ABC transporter permease [Chloroflexota bacterium]